MEEDQTVNIDSLLPPGLMGWLNIPLAAALPWVRKARRVRLCSGRVLHGVRPLNSRDRAGAGILGASHLPSQAASALVPIHVGAVLTDPSTPYWVSVLCNGGRV